MGGGMGGEKLLCNRLDILINYVLKSQKTQLRITIDCPMVKFSNMTIKNILFQPLDIEPFILLKYN